ncbi:MSMEG_1061 family FMN-dependent PPOX-type flavoprotein [Demetria terragena]|uniref:MSMEG_1061 family FMN-dependent PPOX-type flavoprotein n=1 Tax=Demetria terragena TaxID=63959 RepID=UPI000376D027|nr:MSMEG_1061 family FMN-dependent PPOX-type flavoprotein [Demetria terragena]
MKPGPDLSALPRITTVDELVAVVGEPEIAVRDKVQHSLDEVDREFLAASPLCFVATRGSHGADVSPKGDPPGFAVVLDDRTIALPERAGNKRVDGYHNLLEDDRVGLIFLVPGQGYTLRINGRAQLVTDGPFFDDMVVRGHRPELAMVVQIDEVFNHCPKAFMRSKTWKPETWDPDRTLGYADLAKRKWRRADDPREVEEHYSPQTYDRQLYPSD